MFDIYVYLFYIHVWTDFFYILLAQRFSYYENSFKMVFTYSTAWSSWNDRVWPWPFSCQPQNVRIQLLTDFHSLYVQNQFWIYSQHIVETVVQSQFCILAPHSIHQQANECTDWTFARPRSSHSHQITQPPLSIVFSAEGDGFTVSQRNSDVNGP